MRFAALLAPIALLTGLSAGPNPSRARIPFTFNYENVLGTSLELKIEARNSAEADKADTAARREIHREAKILSAWDASSEFSRWAATLNQPVPVSRELFETLSLFDRWRNRTGGALDASAETVVHVWKTAETENRKPSETEIAAAVDQVRHPHWRLDSAAQTATHLDRAPIALNSFAKSYIAGHAADRALAVPGVSSVVVNIGGDLVVRGPRPEIVDIADPRCDAENCTPLGAVEIRGRSIATSGNYRRGVDIAGHHFSHIVDPRTGLTAENVISSTVAAPSPADAGAMATAFSVLTPVESQRVAASIPGVDYLIVTKTGQRFASAAWTKLGFALSPAAAAPAPPTPAAWNPSMELTVNVELAKFARDVRRPYLAVWVENESMKPVRTLALWYNKDRYLVEMKDWYRMAEAFSGAANFAHSIASATRPPGKYTFKWDGKDDAGKPVLAGKYTVFIEAAREHGTHQLMQQEMDFIGTPAKVDLKGNAEIAGASLDYHKIADR
jgi:thiamine biosynthesis lipoprotein ApbE